MNMDKTKFARETGSEEVDLGQFVEDDDEEKENETYDGFDSPVRVAQPLKSIGSKEYPTAKVSEIYSPPNTMSKTSNKPGDAIQKLRERKHIQLLRF